MNQKLCKRLRRAARNATIGFPQRGLVINKETGQIFNNPQTTRGVYRLMKMRVRVARPA